MTAEGKQPSPPKDYSYNLRKEGEEDAQLAQPTTQSEPAKSDEVSANLTQPEYDPKPEDK